MTIVRGTEYAARLKALADLGTAAITLATVAIAGLAAISATRHADLTTTWRLIGALQVAEVLLTAALVVTFGTRALLSSLHDVRIAVVGLSTGTVAAGVSAVALHTVGGSGSTIAGLATSTTWCAGALVLAATLAGGVLIGRTHRA